MRYILIILVFLSVGANAQMIIKAHANYRPQAVAAAFLLDDYPNATGAYSLRKLRSAYSGSAIRVRRSNDNTEQDIGFTASGDLDTASMKTFVGNNSAFLANWYDQSESSPERNMFQSGAANQPRIMLNGVIDRDGARPTVRFNDDNDELRSFENKFTFSHAVTVGKVNTQNTVNYIISAAAPGGGIFYNGTAAGVNGLGAFDGTNARSLTGEDLNRHLGWFSMRSSKIFIARDGGAETDAGAFNATITNIEYLGGRGTGIVRFVGNIQEVVAWNTDRSANKSAIETNVNNYYSVY